MFETGKLETVRNTPPLSILPFQRNSLQTSDSSRAAARRIRSDDG